jgi:hypothetical protein
VSGRAAGRSTGKAATAAAEAELAALRWRVEVACEGYASLTDADVPEHWDMDAYQVGAATAARGILSVLGERQVNTAELAAAEEGELGDVGVTDYRAQVNRVRAALVNEAVRDERGVLMIPVSVVKDALSGEPGGSEL